MRRTFQDQLNADETHAIGLPAILASAGFYSDNFASILVKDYHHYMQGRVFFRQTWFTYK